jgi:hypothetical protein
MRAEFGDDVLFMVLYQREAHAGEMTFSEIEQPETYEERKALAQRTCDELKVATTIVIDDMENTVREAYGRLPNSAYVIAKGGEIVHKEAWAAPADWPEVLRSLLERER